MASDRNPNAPRLMPLRMIRDRLAEQGISCTTKSVSRAMRRAERKIARALASDPLVREWKRGAA